MKAVRAGLGLAALALVGSAQTANAQAIITNGTGIYLGVNLLGNLNVPDGTGGVFLTPVNSSRIGLYSAVRDADATAPGCFCEGWGVAGNGVSGWANVAAGDNNLTSDSFASTATTATVVTSLTSLPGLSVLHEYRASSDARLMEARVTITNGTAATMTDVRYDRTMDWDIDPTTFDEYVTIGGWPATALLGSGNNGFETSNPLSLPGLIGGCGAVLNGNFTDAGICDHGARFVFGFGDLAAGATKSFSIFYGAAPSEREAFSALAAVGAEVYSFGQPSSTGGAEFGVPATYIFAFKGVGGTVVVPEPASLALLGFAFAATAAWRRRAVK